MDRKLIEDRLKALVELKDKSDQDSKELQYVIEGVTADLAEMPIVEEPKPTGVQ